MFYVTKIHLDRGIFTRSNVDAFALFPKVGLDMSKCIYRWRCIRYKKQAAIKVVDMNRFTTNWEKALDQLIKSSQRNILLPFLQYRKNNIFI